MPIPAEKDPHGVFVEHVMTKLTWRLRIAYPNEYGYELVIEGHERRISVHIDYVDGDRGIAQERIEGLEHVIAQMTVATGIKNKTRH
jgi:hypothetical protein